MPLSCERERRILAQCLLVEVRRALEALLSLIDAFRRRVTTFAGLVIVNPRSRTERVEIVPVVILQGCPDELLSGLGEVGLDQEIGVVRAEVEVGRLGSEGLLQQLVSGVVFVQVDEHLRLSDLRYISVPHLYDDT